MREISGSPAYLQFPLRAEHAEQTGRRPSHLVFSPATRLACYLGLSGLLGKSAIGPRGGSLEELSPLLRRAGRRSRKGLIVL